MKRKILSLKCAYLHVARVEARRKFRMWTTRFLRIVSFRQRRSTLCRNSDGRVTAGSKKSIFLAKDELSKNL